MKDSKGKEIIDCTKRYKMKMCVVGTNEKVVEEVEFNYLVLKDGMILIYKEGYDNKYMWPNLFNWFLYTGTIKEISE